MSLVVVSRIAARDRLSQNAVINGSRARQRDSSPDVMARDHIDGGLASKPPAWKGKHQTPETLCPSEAAGIALDAFSVVPGHEMTGANSVVRPVKQKAIRANRLVPMVLYHRRLPKQ